MAYSAVIELEVEFNREPDAEETEVAAGEIASTLRGRSPVLDLRIEDAAVTRWQSTTWPSQAAASRALADRLAQEAQS